MSSRLASKLTTAGRGRPGFRKCIRGAQKHQGPVALATSPCSIGGAKRDRTADLYNAIVTADSFLLLAGSYPRWLAFEKAPIFRL
jgi:hypothetical protein